MSLAYLLQTPLMRRVDDADVVRRLEQPSGSSPVPARPRRRLRPYQTRRVLGLIPAEPPPPDRRYALVASRVMADHGLNDGEKATFAWLASLAGRAGQVDTWVRSIATLAARCVRTILRHLKALEERGHIARLRDPATGKLHVLIAPASMPPPPCAPQGDMLNQALRSRHPRMLDVAQACVRRLAETARRCGQGAVTFVSPFKGSTISEDPAGGGPGPGPASQGGHRGGPRLPTRP